MPLRPVEGRPEITLPSILPARGARHAAFPRTGGASLGEVLALGRGARLPPGRAAVVRVLEPNLAFFPTRGESTTPAEFDLPFERVTIRTGDNVDLHGWSMPHDTPRAHILYFHGNGGNLSIWSPILAGIYH